MTQSRRMWHERGEVDQDNLIADIVDRLRGLEAAVLTNHDNIEDGAQRTTDLEDAGAKVTLDNSTLSQALAESNRSVEQGLARESVKVPDGMVMIYKSRFDELLETEWKYNDLGE